MMQRLLLIGTAMLAGYATACGTDPVAEGPVVDGGNTYTPPGAVGAPDAGVRTSPDGSVISVGATDAGAVIVGATDTEYAADMTGMANLPPASLGPLKDAASKAGAGAGGMGGGNQAMVPCADLLYPYDGTVMPGGLISPPFMFKNGWDAAYVRVGYQNSNRVDYQFAAAASNPGELRIPAGDWAQIVARNPNTAATFTFAFQRGGAVSTCVSRMAIANGNMTGSIYYNTYNHPKSSGTGAVLRLALGQAEPELYLREPLATAPIGPCVGCHSLSNNGQVLAASKHIYFPASFSAAAFTISATPPTDTGGGRDVIDAAFGALTPEGKAIFRMGNPDCTQGANAFPRARNNFPLAVGPTPAGLINTDTSAIIPTTGLLPDHFYWMPQFNAAGNRLVFNNAHVAGNGVERRELAVADFDPATNTFSAPRVIVDANKLAAAGAPTPSLDYAPNPVDIANLGGLLTPVGGTGGCNNNWEGDGAHTASIPGGSCTGPCYPAWPFFTPDGKGVIFALVSEPDFAVAFPGRDKPSKSELWYIDVATQQMVRLDKANKVPDGDAQANYYPTVLPVQVGGYYWMFWTSRRAFGHRDLTPPPEAVLNDAVFGSSSASEAFRKRIWVAAIMPPGAGEFSGGPLTDPSMPPFYLEGQSATGNTRAFAALNPCKQDSNECLSGLDCCSGYCNFDETTKKGVCGPKKTCAKLNEKCQVDSECCPPAAAGDQPLKCLGGFCGYLLR